MLKLARRAINGASAPGAGSGSDSGMGGMLQLAGNGIARRRWRKRHGAGRLGWQHRSGQKRRWHISGAGGLAWREKRNKSGIGSGSAWRGINRSAQKIAGGQLASSMAG